MNHQLKYAKLEEKLAVKTTELQTQLENVMGEIHVKNKIIQKLEPENTKLQENFHIVCSYVDDNCHSNKNQGKYAFFFFYKKGTFFCLSLNFLNIMLEIRLRFS